MGITLGAVEAIPEEVGVVGVGFFTGLIPAVEGGLSIDPEVLRRRNFDGDAGQVLITEVGQKVVLVLGLGEREQLTVDGLRRAAASFARSVGKYETAALVLSSVEAGVDIDKAAVSQALAEGVLLASYRYTEWKSKPEPSTLTSMVFVGADAAAVERGERIANAVCFARDLINGPPRSITPTHLAQVAQEIADSEGLRISVLDEAAIERERLGGLLGVARGSDEPPRFIELAYQPEGATSTVVLVGKGITFDSGGLSLKPAEGMMTMKTDMSGAAAVLAVMSVVPSLGLPHNVVGLIAATENLPGPKATKPGDVLRARNGKTMEVLNTDAEGRLVLSDALSLAVEMEPDAIIDIATLTGACMVALGDDIAGAFSNHDGWWTQIEAAADRSGESLWRMPLHKRYRRHIDSSIADIKNIGAPRSFAGAISAALFLQEFVDEVPWAHLDIAGPSRADADEGYVTKGGTAFGVRTLIELVSTFSKP